MYELKIVRERRSGYGLRQRFRGSADIYESFKEHFAQLDREHFVVLLLDAKNVMLGFHTVSIGSLTSSLVHPREVYKPVVLYNDGPAENTQVSDKRDMHAQHSCLRCCHDSYAQPPQRRSCSLAGRPPHH